MGIVGPGFLVSTCMSQPPAENHPESTLILHRAHLGQDAGDSKVWTLVGKLHAGAFVEMNPWLAGLGCPKTGQEVSGEGELKLISSFEHPSILS